MKITTFSKKGTYHQIEGKPNQDKFVLYEDSSTLILSLADGVSSCQESDKGALIATNNASKYMLDCQQQLFKNSPEETKKNLFKLIKNSLFEEALICNQDILDYASTLICLYIDKENKQVFLLNLGDGIVLSANKNEYEILLRPEDNSNGVHSTIHKSASENAKVRTVNLDNKDSFLLATDGAWREMFYRNKIKKEIQVFIKNKDFENLKNYFQNENFYDDQSYIAVELN